VDIQLIRHIKDMRILDFPSGLSSFVAEVYNDYTIDNVVECNLLYDVDIPISLNTQTVFFIWLF